MITIHYGPTVPAAPTRDRCGRSETIAGLPLELLWTYADPLQSVGGESQSTSK
jgi:hypothetical protein